MLHESSQMGRVDQTAEALRQGLDPAPVVVEIHPTDFCNQRCSYCFHGGVGEDPTRRGELLTGEDYNKLIGEAEAMGVEEISVSGGGEPFFYKDIADVLDRLAESPMRTRIVTNGNHMPEIVIPGVLAADEIRFSIDSIDSEVYNKMRGMAPGNKLLERTLANIGRLVQARAAAPESRLSIGATFILGPDNLEGIEAFADTLLGELGIDQVIFKHDIYGKVVAGEADHEAAIDAVERAKEKFGDKVEFRSEVGGDITGLACATPYFKVAFNPYGQLYSCCLGSQPGEVNGSEFGSLKKHGSLGELWASSYSSRIQMLGGVGCTDCNFTDQQLNAAMRGALGLPQTATSNGRRLLPFVSTHLK